MVSGIDSSAVAVSGNLSVLKKAMESEEAVMGSLISGMQGAQANLQTQSQASTQPQPTQTSSNTNTLDIMA